MNENLNLAVSLNDRIDAALAALHEKTPRAHTRRIKRGDYVAHLTRALSLVQDGDEYLTFIHIGGFVPDAYGDRAPCDRLEVTIDLHSDMARVSAYRSTAPARPYGRGNCYNVRLERDGLMKGRWAGW